MKGLKLLTQTSATNESSKEHKTPVSKLLIKLVTLTAIFTLLLTSTASALTFNPDPPVVGQPTVVESETIVAASCPDPSIDGSAEFDATHFTSGASVTQAMPISVTTNASGQWVVTSTATVVFSESGTWQSGVTYTFPSCTIVSPADRKRFTVAEDANVPVVDMRVAAGFSGVLLAGFVAVNVMRRRNDKVYL